MINATGGTTKYSEATDFVLRVSRVYAAVSVSLWLRADGEAYIRYPLVWSGLDNGYDVYFLRLRITTPGLYFYNFTVDGKKVTSHYPESGSDYQLTVYESVYKELSKYGGGLMYQIMVDRFNIGGGAIRTRDDVKYKEWGDVPDFLPVNGQVLNNDLFGGNLRGVLEKLPYLASLGVTVIYLNPIFSAFSNHKYDTADYNKIDETFGTESDFIELCKQAGTLGISIILDGVFSHTGDDSVYFNKYNKHKSVGAYQSKLSPYYSWYTFKKHPEDYTGWWGFKTLPETNENDPGFNEFINGAGGVVARWLKAGAMGFRLDVADELPDSFIINLTGRAKAVKKDALIIGEVWEDASNKLAYSERKKYFLGRELDGVMNYPIRNGIIDYVRNGNLYPLVKAIDNLVNLYTPNAVSNSMNMLGTHDTVRILNVLSGQRTNLGRNARAHEPLSTAARKLALARERLAAVIQYFLPGIPCIYYGDEAGLEGDADPFNRACYPYGNEDMELIGFYKKLGKIRRSCKRACSGSYKTLYSEEGIYIFERGGELIVVINNGADIFECYLDDIYIDLMTGNSIETVSVPPGDYKILKKRNTRKRT